MYQRTRETRKRTLLFGIKNLIDEYSKKKRNLISSLLSNDMMKTSLSVKNDIVECINISIICVRFINGKYLSFAPEKHLFMLIYIYYVFSLKQYHRVAIPDFQLFDVKRKTI